LRLESGTIGGIIGAESNRGSDVKKFAAEFLLAAMLLLSGSASAESVKISLFVEGTVIGAQRFRHGLKYTTKISLREDAGHEAAESRRFCGDWEEQINGLRGQRIRLELNYKEYAPNECRKINTLELLTDPLPQ